MMIDCPDLQTLAATGSTCCVSAKRQHVSGVARVDSATCREAVLRENVVHRFLSAQPAAWREDLRAIARSPLSAPADIRGVSRKRVSLAHIRARLSLCKPHTGPHACVG